MLWGFFHMHSNDKIYSLKLYHLLNFTLHSKANACNTGTCFRFYMQMRVEKTHKAFAYRIYSHFTQQCTYDKHVKVHYIQNEAKFYQLILEWKTNKRTAWMLLPITELRSRLGKITFLYQITTLSLFPALTLTTLQICSFGIVSFFAIWSLRSDKIF